jgi:hypothetical protein
MNSNSSTQIVDDYVALVSLLGTSIDSLKGWVPPGPDDRLNCAEGLAVKFLIHALSILYLKRGTILPDFPLMSVRFVDPGSINVLVRAALETYLSFHFVFAAPLSTDDQNYRYWAYKAAGLVGRQQLNTSTLEHAKKQLDEKVILTNLHNMLDSNCIFQQLSKKQQTFVKQGNWRQYPQEQVSWKQIALSAGLSTTIATTMYGHLSGYAHSDSLSIMQISQSLNNKEQDHITNSSMMTTNIAAANFINDFSKIFSLAKAALDSYPNGHNIVDLWTKIGQSLDRENK